MMGLSIGLLLARGDMSVVKLWLVQLIVNFLWSVLFFGLRSPLLGLVAILLLVVLVFTYIIYAAGRSSVAAWLFVPYLLWLLLATYLNGYIYIYNRYPVAVATAQIETTQPTIKTNYTMHFSLPTLPYATDALAPAMSRETIDYHYGKHYACLCDNLSKSRPGHFLDFGLGLF
jgi:hypothetical protein